jgi:predicted nucleic acid-binding protein
MAEGFVICDSDVLIDYFDKNKPRHFFTKTIIEEQIELSRVVISIISKMELLSGTNNKEKETMVLKNLNSFSLLLINDSISKIAIELFTKYRLSHGLKIPDCFIAATAIESGLELFTYNSKDFKFIQGLKQKII